MARRSSGSGTGRRCEPAVSGIFRITDKEILDALSDTSGARTVVDAMNHEA